MKIIIKASFFQKIVLPAMLAIVLFLISVFVFIIPRFEENAILEKQTMLRELTNSAWSILNKYHSDYLKGKINLEEAKEKAIGQIEALRYGLDKKDYFWITDFTPTMVMHPYLHELNGKSLHDFADPDGKKLFMEALKIAKTKGEGYISYKWQLKDDSTHIVAKLSFVKKFEHWNWIIGTGIYLQDVDAEISSLTRKLLLILLGISIIISLIIAFITYQSLKIEKKREQTEKQLQDSKEKYKTLLESTTEGIILLLNSQISFTNSFIQNWLGYSADELLKLSINSILTSEQSLSFETIDSESKLEVILMKKDGNSTEAILTVLPVSFANQQGLLLTFRDISEHRSVRNELEEYKNRLQNISNISDLGIFRILINKNDKFVELNKILVNILGYNDEEDLKDISLSIILNNRSDLKSIIKELKANKLIEKKHIQLVKKDKSIIDVILSLALEKSDDPEILCCNGIIKPLKKNFSIDEIYNPLNFLTTIFAQNNQRAIFYKDPIISCLSNTPISKAIEIMDGYNSDFLLILHEERTIGIVTHSDIIHRVLINSNTNNQFISDIMTSPVISANENLTIVESVSLMRNYNISYLLLKNNNNEPVGVLSKNRLFGIFVNPIEVIIDSLERSRNLIDLKELRKNVNNVLIPMLNELGNVQIINKIISFLNDIITKKIIEQAVNEIGAPPVPFSFIVIGSAGRNELTFNSDQDNAIVYEDNANFKEEDLQKYFLNLATKICLNLDDSGLPKCKGDYMASNPKWCKPLSIWKEYFSDWIEHAEPINILNISVFFDLRLAYGDKNLFNDLEDYVFESLKGRSAFYYFLAQSIVGFKQPINVFGNFITETTGKNIDSFDIKNSLAPVVMFTRIFALHNNIRAKDTLDRINALHELQVLSKSTCDEINFHFNYLMYQRLKIVAQHINNNNELTTYISPKKLTEMEQLILKKILTQIGTYQEKLTASFMSSYKTI